MNTGSLFRAYKSLRKLFKSVYSIIRVFITTVRKYQLKYNLKV